MKTVNHTQTLKSFTLKSLVVAIAAYSLSPHDALGGPSGGVVVGGTGTITQAGTETRIDQRTDRLSLEWDSFNVGTTERVEFVQPGADSIALNRILDSSGSQILGRIDANGQVILMNPNGVFFGEDAVVDVGGLVASGLNIHTDDFMNGELLFGALDGTSGTVINHGLINAATGGNVALLGKRVANHGLISAELGHVALAAGSAAVVTFDDQGLIGVRIDEATLAEEVGSAYAVNNNGSITAKGGKILLNASASADLFSAAVNSGGMGGADVVFHDDGSFTLGSGNSVINTGNLNASHVSSSSALADELSDGGTVILAGESVEQRGMITANASGDNKAGEVYLHGYDRVRMTGSSRVEANAAAGSGKVSIDADNILSVAGASVDTTGNAYIRSYRSARLPAIVANNLKITSLDTVTQVAGAQVAGETRISTTAGGNIRLNHANNDFNLVSIDTGYNDYVAIADRNDLVLGNIRMEDSSLRVDALGEGATISQAAGSKLYVSAGTLRMSADNIHLGEEGATTQLSAVSLQMDFGSSIATNGSISLEPYGSFYANTARIRGMDREYGDVYLDLRGDRDIDLNADIDLNNLRLTLHGMTGSNATLGGYMETEQTAPIILSGTLTWNSYMATLTDPGNDITALQGSGGPAFGWLKYTDANDVLLRNLKTDTEVSLDIRSVGEGATLLQAANTTISADFIELAADNIVLGASGTSSISAGYVFDMSFGETLILNGPWQMGGWYAPMFRITGNDRNNLLVFGPHATNDSFAGDELMATLDIQLKGGNDTVIFNSPFPVGSAEYYSVNQLDMGEGDDRVHYNQSVEIPLFLGPGKDLLFLWDMSTYYDAQDFDDLDDRLVVLSP